MDKVKNIEQAKVKKVITFLKNGGQLSIFSPYFLKHDVFYDIKGNALKFSDEVDPKSDPLFLIGNYYKKGYEQGWMLEGVPCVDSMCSIQMKADFITRWQYTTIKIVEIDRVEQSGAFNILCQLKFKYRARYLNALQSKSLTEINTSSNCEWALSISR